MNKKRECAASPKQNFKNISIVTANGRRRHSQLLIWSNGFKIGDAILELTPPNANYRCLREDQCLRWNTQRNSKIEVEG